jgi:hypothetical protein
MMCVDGAPPVLGGHDQLERHGQLGRLVAGPASDLCAVPDGGEGRLDGVRGPQMDPAFRGVVVEGEQLVEVVGALRDAWGNLAPNSSVKTFTAARAWDLSSTPQISARAFFAAGCTDFGSAASTFADLWNQQRCSRVSGKTSRRPPQDPSAPSPTASTGARIPRHFGASPWQRERRGRGLEHPASEPFRWVSPREIIGDDEGPGLSGVREPRRPRPPHRSDAAEEATPPTD